MTRGAYLTADQRHRLWLTRDWAHGPVRILWIGMNPSTADASEDDPTIRRMVGFSLREGAGGMMVLNLSTFRATDPAAMLAATDKRCWETDWLEIRDQVCDQRPQAVVACWGALRWDRPALAVPALTDLCARVRVPLVCLGRTKDGAPRHPLYVRADKPFEPFGGAL